MPLKRNYAVCVGGKRGELVYDQRNAERIKESLIRAGLFDRETIPILYFGEKDN